MHCGWSSRRTAPAPEWPTSGSSTPTWSATAFADPVAQRVEAAFPAWLTKRLTPEVAGATIVNGIERRAPRMIAPRWWGAWSALRGVVNPFFDRYSERDDEIAEAIREGERNPYS